VFQVAAFFLGFAAAAASHVRALDPGCAEATTHCSLIAPLCCKMFLYVYRRIVCCVCCAGIVVCRHGREITAG
jgi:hypothetical protein